MGMKKFNIKQKTIKVLKFLLKELGYRFDEVRVPMHHIGIEPYDGIDYPTISKIRINRRFNNRDDGDHMRRLEELKRELLRELEDNFFYYFPVKHQTVGGFRSMYEEEDYQVTFYYTKHHM